MKIIYLRTSTEDQTPENQLADCKKITSKPYEIIIEKQSAFKDVGREKFENLKDRIKNGEITELICWDFDRLYRNRKKFKDFLALLNAYDVKLHSYRQQWFEQFHKIPAPWNEIVGDLVINIYGHIAEDESKKKSERVRIAYQNRTKKWGRKPLENVEARVIELYKEGKSIREISTLIHYWDSSRNKKYISKSAVHKIIQKHKGGLS